MVPPIAALTPAIFKDDTHPPDHVILITVELLFYLVLVDHGVPIVVISHLVHQAIPVLIRVLLQLRGSDGYPRLVPVDVIVIGIGEPVMGDLL